MFSLDISNHKAGINIEELVKEGLVHLYMKATESTNFLDKYMEGFYNEAHRLGVPCGFYHFARPNDPEGQAEYFYNAVKDKSCSLRYCLDMEVDMQDISDFTRRFCRRFEELMGRSNIMCIYASAYYARDNFDQDIKEKYPLWVANYNSSQNVDTGWKDIAGWQYSESEIHQGQECDANIFYAPIVIPGDTQPVKVSEPGITISGNLLVKQAQGHANNFAGCSLLIDGFIGKESRKATVKVVQHAANLDYQAGLEEDGDWGSKTDEALQGHYVKIGESQHLVTAVEILLLFNGYDPHGVESPGVFGQGLEATVKQYQIDNGLSPDGIAGFNTIRSLVMN